MKYFTSGGDPAINFEKVDMKALEMLEQAREYANIPIKITSSYRTPERCIEIGSKPDSAHTEIPCTAFDISACDARERGMIIKALYIAGFDRIGLNLINNHIHVDDSPTKPHNVFFIE